MVWLVAGNDIIRKRQIIKLPVWDFIYGYEHALEELLDKYFANKA